MRRHIKNSDLGKKETSGAASFPCFVAGFFMLLCCPVWAASNADIHAVPDKIHLQTLIDTLHLQGTPEKLKVEAINAFFNRVPREHDRKAWGQKDYWATPDELLQRRMGDCEDVAIAKYFTLRKLGVSDRHLRLAYGKIADFKRGIIEPHMVLIYKPGNARPLVLDSLNLNLLRVSERQDLILEYTFNTKSLWRWQATSSVLLGKADVLEPWRNLLKRL